MDLISRAQWGARAYREPSGSIRYAGPRRGVKVHYLGAPYTSRPHAQCAAYVRQVQAQHMDGNGWSDIGYSYLVCEHGSVYEGRGLARRNSANGNTALNEAHYAVCAIHGTSGEPGDALLAGLRDAIDYCRTRGPAGTDVLGHRDGHATACPGDALYAWVRAGAPRPTTPPETGGTDVPEHIYYERKGPVTLTPGDWYTITWDRLWRPGVGWADRDLAQTLLSGEHFFSLDFGVRADGLSRGQEIQMRVARNHRRPGEEWARAKSWPIGSPVHDGGRLHAVHHWQGHLPGSDDNRLVAEVLALGPEPIRIDELTASLLAWPA